jgi:hypothetical protein
MSTLPGNVFSQTNKKGEKIRQKAAGITNYWSQPFYLGTGVLRFF